MEEVVLFTRQKRDGSAESEQQTLEAQIRVIEEYAGQLNLRIRDRFVEAGISARESNRISSASLRGPGDHHLLGRPLDQEPCGLQRLCGFAEWP